MTYTFKLSRRLALAHIVSMLAVLTLLVACSTSDLTESSSTPSDGTPKLAGIIVSPRRVVLEPNQPFSLSSLRRSVRGATAPIETEWTATGGTISPDGVFSAAEAGTYKVVGKGRGRGRTKDDTTVVVVTPTPPSLNALSISPDPASVATSQAHLFTATGVLTDGSVVETAVTWEATGGTIDGGGLYTAGSSGGDYRVVARAVSADLADTALVTIASATPTVTSVVLTPATVSLTEGATHQFTGTARLSDGSTSQANAAYQASGGSITSSGLYTAGTTAGTYRVIASVGDKADTAAVTIAASTPAPTGTTFFLADGEQGTMTPPWSYVFSSVGHPPTRSTARARSGSGSYRYYIPSSVAYGGHSTQTLLGGPQVPMGTASGKLGSGWYSWWMYLESGFDDATMWNMVIGWMTGQSGAPNPISHLEMRKHNGVLQLVYVLKNCAVGNYPCPNIAGYVQEAPGYYFMTPSSPAGIMPLPRARWVHIAAYYKLSATNGEVEVWQDGVKIMDLTAPTMNTAYGHDTSGGSYCFCNPGMDIFLQFGQYGQYQTGDQIMYVDDFRISDFRPLP